MNVQWVTAMMFLVGNALCLQDAIQRRTNIGISVRDHYKSSCVLLLHNADQELYKSLFQMKFEKALTEKYISVSTLAFKHLNGTEGVGCNSLMFVILFADSKVQQALVKLSSKTSLSFAKWLMFMEPHESIQDFFANIHVPYNCRFTIAQEYTETIVTFTEIYEIHHSIPLQSNEVATWSTEQGLDWTERTFYQRRGNLQNITLTAAVVFSGYGSVKTEDNRTKAQGLAGFTGNIWVVIEKAVNLSTDCYYTTKHELGTIYSNGTATGMFEMVMKKETDMGLETYTINPSYLPYVKFLYPTWKLRLSVFIQEPPTYDSLLDAVAAPFAEDMWMAVISSILVYIIFLTTTWYIGCAHAGLETPGEEAYTLNESWLYVVGIFCQQGHDVTPRSLSSRIVYLMTLFTAVIVFESYSAIIISFLTVKKTELPFTDFQGLLDHGGYKLGIPKHNAIIFEEATDPMLKKVYEKLIQHEIHNLPSEEMLGFQRLCREKNYAYMTAPFFMRVFRKHITCKIVEIPGASVVTYGSIVVDKSLPYVGLFNKKLHDMASVGILHKIQEDDSPSMVKDTPENEVTRVTLGSVAPILIILVIGIVIALVCFCVENVYHHQVKRVILYKPNRMSLRMERIRLREQKKLTAQFIVIANNMAERKVLYPEHMLPSSSSIRPDRY